MKRESLYAKVFTGFLVSVILVFFYMRPLNSPWQQFIAGDGLGYYSYLPAKFIYNDNNYDFKWFNKAHNANYIYSTFPNPEDNLLVKYGDKRINKYYQGLSYIWFPFFIAGHNCAMLFDYPADGYSLPYQLSIGFASLFYLLIGLIFLRKLILKLFQNQVAALVVPVAIFYGTSLFPYSIVANSLSHSYSFTFITLFIYYVVSFFKADENRLYWFLMASLFFTLAVCIRPLTGLIILVVPAFIPKGFFKQGLNLGKIKWWYILPVLILLGALYNQLGITYKQTHSLLAYTYTDEKFYFDRSKFWEALFSYNMGLFVYVPVTFISLFGIFFLPRRMQLILPLFFFLIVYIYGSWWFWPICKRALIDFFVIPGIFLGGLITANANGKKKITLLLLIGACILYYQLKFFQVTKGILDENNTYKEVFWENFFRINKANRYLVPPSTIIDKVEFTDDFEKGNTTAGKTNLKMHSGNYSIVCDPAQNLVQIAKWPYPPLFSKKGIRKIRFSFWTYFEKDISTAHFFIQFYKNDSLKSQEPIYLHSEDIIPGKWDYKEFGCEMGDTMGLNARTVNRIGLAIWNVEGKRAIYIDDVKAEFILADRSFENIK